MQFLLDAGELSSGKVGNQGFCLPVRRASQAILVCRSGSTLQRAMSNGQKSENNRRKTKGSGSVPVLG